MQSKIIHSLPKFLIGLLFWATYFWPIYSFEKAFRLLEVESNDFYGIYPDGTLICSLLAIVLTFLFFWVSPKYFHKPAYKISIAIVYLSFYYFACTSIAFDYRIVFGTTWLWSEIFLELVKPHWFFYVFGMLGVFFHYQFQQLISKK